MRLENRRISLIIAGGRNYTFGERDIRRLDQIRHRIKEVVSGRASGADAEGEKWAKSLGIPVRHFPADWKAHGRAAGPTRNRKMAEHADAVVLFPGGRGTESMAREAAKAGLETFDFRETGEDPARD